METSTKSQIQEHHILHISSKLIKVGPLLTEPINQHIQDFTIFSEAQLE